MSQPKRYDVGMETTTDNRTGMSSSMPWVYPTEQGKYVLYSDYAALAAENERLQSSVRHYVEQEALRKAGEAIHQQRIESGACNREKNETIKRLTAENERLRMAGDQMAKEINDAQKYMSEGYPEEVWASINAWKAAKEGGAK